MRWTWNAQKERSNRRMHGLSFKTASGIFDDPLAMTRPDDTPDEERWQTVGEVGGVVAFVVHTWPEPDGSGEEIGRILSARKATSHERRAYEKGEF